MDEVSVEATLTTETGEEPFSVIAIRGELDLSNVESIRSVVLSGIESSPERLAFELAELTFMDSTGIALLVRAANAVGSVELRHPTTVVRRIIEVTGLSTVFEIVP